MATVVDATTGQWPVDEQGKDIVPRNYGRLVYCPKCRLPGVLFEEYRKTSDAEIRRALQAGKRSVRAFKPGFRVVHTFRYRKSTGEWVESNKHPVSFSGVGFLQEVPSSSDLVREKV